MTHQALDVTIDLVTDLETIEGIERGVHCAFAAAAIAGRVTIAVTPTRDAASWRVGVLCRHGGGDTSLVLVIRAVDPSSERFVDALASALRAHCPRVDEHGAAIDGFSTAVVAPAAASNPMRQDLP
jgi:hypothetical protein